MTKRTIIGCKKYDKKGKPIKAFFCSYCERIPGSNECVLFVTRNGKKIKYKE